MLYESFPSEQTPTDSESGIIRLTPPWVSLSPVRHAQTSREIRLIRSRVAQMLYGSFRIPTDSESRFIRLDPPWSAFSPVRLTPTSGAMHLVPGLIRAPADLTLYGSFRSERTRADSESRWIRLDPPPAGWLTYIRYLKVLHGKALLNECFSFSLGSHGHEIDICMQLSYFAWVTRLWSLLIYVVLFGAGRVVNVLTPRQLGIITQKLTKSKEKDSWPNSPSYADSNSPNDVDDYLSPPRVCIFIFCASHHWDFPIDLMVPDQESNSLSFPLNYSIVTSRSQQKHLTKSTYYLTISM